MKYDPLSDVDPKAWMALDEFERIDAVVEYHRRKRVHLPNVRAHALFHVIVENQVALGDEYPYKSTLERLMNEGLNRHEAIHAISTVLSGEVYHALRREKVGHDLKTEYEEGLKKLTAESWRKMEV
jgi:hypothetical protein